LLGFVILIEFNTYVEFGSKLFILPLINHFPFSFNKLTFTCFKVPPFLLNVTVAVAFASNSPSLSSVFRRKLNSALVSEGFDHSPFLEIIVCDLFILI